jgi:hypothetical protein
VVPVGVTGGTPSVAPGETLDSQEQAARVQRSMRTVSTASDHPALPLGLAAVLLLALVFGPLVWQRRPSEPPDPLDGPRG